MNETILVTGAAGFLGNAVAHRLHEAGTRVVGLDPMASDDPTPWPMIQDDLSEPAILNAILAERAITAVVHAGGVSGPMVLADDPAAIMRINVANTLNLVFAALACGIGRFVYCSSLSAVGDYTADTPIDDDPPLRPASAYGCSKAAVDMVLTGLYRRVPMDIVSLRFTGIYGPGRRTQYVVDDLIDAALEGHEAVVPSQSAWPFVYIDDAADATVAALSSQRRQQLFYTVAHPEMVSLAALADHVTAACGPLRWREDRADTPAQRGPVSIAAATRDFGFEPAVTMAEGVRRMVAARGGSRR